MDDPYNSSWSTHEYTEQRLVTHTCAKAFSLTLRYTTRYFVHQPSRTRGLLEDTSRKYSSASQHKGVISRTPGLRKKRLENYITTSPDYL
jgi:hypothetical protein